MHQGNYSVSPETLAIFGPFFPPTRLYLVVSGRYQADYSAQLAKKKVPKLFAKAYMCL